MDELDISGKRYISTRRASREHGYHSDYMGQLIRSKKVAGQKVGRAWYIDEDSLNAYLGKAPIPAPAPVAVAEPAPALAPVAEVAVPATPPIVPAISEQEAVEEVEQAVPAPEAHVQPAAHAAVFEPVVIHEPVAAYEPASKITEEIREDAQPIAVRIQPQAAQPAYQPVENKIYHPPFAHEHMARIPTQSYAPAVQQTGGLRYAEDEAPFAPAAIHAKPVSAAAYAAPRHASAPRQAGSFPFVSLSVVGVIALLIAVFASNFVSATIVSEEGKTATVDYAIHW